MFLVRTAFWLSVVVMLLPADSETGDKAPRVTAFEAIVAARTAVTGSAFQVFTEKVRYGAKMLYGYFGDHKVGGNPADGSGTLKPEDVAPAWHDPKKDGSA